MTSDVRCEPDHIIAVEAGGVGGGQIVGNDDGVGWQVGEQTVLASHEITQDPAADITDIRRPFAEILVGQLRKRLGVLGSNIIEDVLHILFFRCHAGRDRLDQCRVLG